jgi:diguanylate cyclase (GGDEF)-like protein
MTVTSAPRADVDLLVLTAEEILSAATDERGLLAVATGLLGQQYGYGARYVVLHDPIAKELYLGGAAGPIADMEAMRDYRRPEGAGLSGGCFMSGEVVNVPDVRADSRYMEVLPACRSEICVPIVAREQVLGVLGIQSDRVAAFDEHDERVLSAYARLLGHALVHARTHQARQKDIAELQAVSEVARRAAALDLDATMSSVVESFRRITTSDSVAIYLWDSGTERLNAMALSYNETVYGADYAEAVRSRPLAMGEGMIGWAALHREPIRIDDVMKDGRALALTGTPIGQKSAIVVPLLVEGRLVGVARAVKVGIRSFDDDHFRFAQTLALQAALAIAAAEAHEEIRRLSITDELTGAFNTRYAMQRMREELEFAKRHDDCVSLLVLDGDAMKKVNDEFGHAEGNRLLVQVTETMRGALRMTDVLARFGGDEFLVVLPRTCAKDALVAAERIRLAIAGRQYRTSWGESLRMTFSVGVATSSPSSLTADDVFRAADRALYIAKQAGRNRAMVATA